MTISKKIALVRSMLGAPSDDGAWSDSVLEAYLFIAGNKIIHRAYPYRDDLSAFSVPDKYDVLQCEIAVYLLNKRGAEGQLSHLENGISRTYESADVPDSMLREVTPYCGVIG